MNIGELFVSLGFNVDDKKLKEFNEELKKTKEGMIGVVGTAIGSVAALNGFMSNSATLATNLSNITSELGTNARALQQWALVANQVNPNVPVEAYLERFKKFTEVIKQQIPQGEGASGTLSRLFPGWSPGMSVEDTLNGIQQNKQNFIAENGGDTRGEAIYSSLLARMGLNDTFKAFDYDAAQREKMAGGYVITAEQIANLTEYKQKVAALDQAFQQLTNAMSDQLTNAMTPLIEDFKTLADIILNLDKQYKGTALAVGAGVVGAGAAGLTAAKGMPWGMGAVAGAAGRVGKASAMVMLLEAMKELGWEGGHMIGQNLKAEGWTFRPQDATYYDFGFHKGEKPLSQAPGKNNKEFAIEYFKSKGWTEEHARGMVNRLSIESGMRPDIYGHGKEAKDMPSEAYGIAQWHPDRQKDFFNFSGKDIHASTLQEQLDFLQYELTTGKEKRAGDMLKQTTSERGAQGVFTAGFERPEVTKNINIYVTGQHPEQIGQEVMRQITQQERNGAYAQTSTGGY